MKCINLTPEEKLEICFAVVGESPTAIRVRNPATQVRLPRSTRRRPLVFNQQQARGRRKFWGWASKMWIWRTGFYM